MNNLLQLEQLDNLIDYYEDEVKDLYDFIAYARDEQHDHYEGRFQQLNEVIEDLKSLKKGLGKNHD